MPDTFNFSDVFISYSRKDKDFARRLFDRLKAENREVWADWEDIPATADWWAEVQAGIEGANTFVFVISPDSVMSDVCRREIDHAMKSNKRFVPVLYREIVEPAHKERVHGAISSHNWIYFRDTDDFETAYQRLIASLETDLNHVRLHTRYLVRAREWDSRQRIPGFLLAGTELKDGQQWLTQGANLEPNPTPLHHEYIAASAQARRRQQFLQIGLVVGLVVSVVMALLAFSQFRVAATNAAAAQEARETSDANANIAVTNAEDARSQAGTAQAAGSTSDANAIIAQNAADANATAQAVALNNANYAATQAAVALNNAATATNAQGYALFQAATAVAAQSTSDANAIIAAQQAATAEYSDGISRSIALSAQSQLDINGSSPERALRLALDAIQFLPYTQQAERALGLAVQNNRVGDVYYLEGGTGINSIAFSPDGKRFVTAGNDGFAYVWDTTDVNYALTLQGHNAPIEDAVFSPDGRYIATASDDTTAILWDAETGDILRQFTGHTFGVRKVAFSPDSRYLVTASDDTTAIIWDAAKGTSLHTLQGHLDRLTDAIFSPDGKTVVTSSWDTSIIFWDAATGRELHRWGGGEVATGRAQIVNSLAFSPDGRYLLTAGDDSRAMIWNIADGQQAGPPLGTRDRVLTARWSADGKKILTASNDGTIQVWTPVQAPDAPANSYNSVLQFSAGVIKDAVFSTLTGDVVTAGADGKVKFWDTTTNRAKLTLGDTQSMAVFSPDGKRVLTGSSGVLHFWDAFTGKEISPSWSMGQSEIFYNAVFSPDGSRVAVDTGENKTLILNADGSTLWIDGWFPSWSPDGSSIASAVNTSVVIWDANTGEQRMTLDGHTIQVYSLAWSPDSSYLLSGSGDGNAIIWDAETGEQLYVLAEHTESISSVAWSPDGSRVATASSDGTARIWDANTGEQLKVLSGHTGPLESVRWSPNGARLITASRDRTARVWDADSGTEILTFVDNQIGALISADWSPDGTQIVTTADNGQVQVWTIWQTLDDLVSYASSCCYIPDLTEQEKQQFGLTNIPGA